MPLYLQVYNFLYCYKIIEKLEENSSSVMSFRQNPLWSYTKILNKNTFKRLFLFCNSEYCGISLVPQIIHWIDYVCGFNTTANLSSLSQLSLKKFLSNNCLSPVDTISVKVSTAAQVQLYYALRKSALSLRVICHLARQTKVKVRKC